MTETELYPPIRDFFLSAGYDVQAEVKHCDVVAVKDEETIIVELKTGLTIALLIQALERQRLTKEVYLGVPAKVLPRLGSKRTKLLRLVRRLELGLITVDLNKASVQVVCVPEPFDQERSVKRAIAKTLALHEELRNRSLRNNIGGSSKQSIMTAYRERALAIAEILTDKKPRSAREMAPKGGDKGKTRTILYQNHYGWFIRIGDGTYTLSEAGFAAIGEFTSKK